MFSKGIKYKLYLGCIYISCNSDYCPGKSEQDVTGKHQKELGLLAC
jgi:hypothetical protein